MAPEEAMTRSWQEVLKITWDCNLLFKGTFANTRLINKLVPEVGPNTVHFPTGKQMAIYDAAMLYQEAGFQ